MVTEAAVLDYATLLYVETLGICFVMTFVLLLFSIKSWKPKIVNPLFCAYIVLMISVAADIAWAFVDGKPQFTALNYLLNIVEFTTFGLIGFLWYDYARKYFLLPFWKKKSTAFIVAIPIIVVIGIIVLSPVLGWTFYIDEAGLYHRGKYFFLQQTGFIYLIFTSALALVSCAKSRLTVEKKHLAVIAAFSIPPITFGLLQLFFPPGMLPTLQYSIFISMLLIFVSDQNRKITRDPLTKLTNRYEFERQLLDKMSRRKYNSEKELFLIMCDLNNFKEINDKFGHVQGDVALRQTAETLDRLGVDYEALVSRFGGDEFCVLIEAEDEETIWKYVNSVDRELEEISKHSLFEISYCAGIYKYDGKLSMLEFINAADQKMYERKREYQASLI